VRVVWCTHMFSLRIATWCSLATEDGCPFGAGSPRGSGDRVDGMTIVAKLG
jgi:hypothetical protein